MNTNTRKYIREKRGQELGSYPLDCATKLEERRQFSNIKNIKDLADCEHIIQTSNSHSIKEIKEIYEKNKETKIKIKNPYKDLFDNIEEL